MKYITLDMSELFYHFKKINNEKSFEIFLVSNYEYPFTNRTIKSFKDKLKEIYDTDKIKLICPISRYNLVVHSVLSIIYFNFNKKVPKYKWFSFNKIVEVEDSVKLLVEFKYK